MATYEPIMDALLALLRAQCGDTFNYYSRRFLMWEQIVQATNSGTSPIRQPALCLFDGIGLGGGRIKYEPRGRGNPGVRTIDRTIVIYARLPRASDSGADSGASGGPDAKTAGGSVFHSLMESVENALNQNDLQQGTGMLGGLVSHCWLEGDGLMLTGETDPDGQGMATMPVRIMVP